MLIYHLADRHKTNKEANNQTHRRTDRRRGGQTDRQTRLQSGVAARGDVLISHGFLLSGGRREAGRCSCMSAANTISNYTSRNVACMCGARVSVMAARVSVMAEQVAISMARWRAAAPCAEDGRCGRAVRGPPAARRTASRHRRRHAGAAREPRAEEERDTPPTAPAGGGAAPGHTEGQTACSV